MKALQFLVIAIAAAVLLAHHAALAAGPELSYGNWQFTGKDSAGVAWTGPLVIEKLDTDRFDPAKYNYMCKLDMKSASSERGVEAPCKFDSASKTLTIGAKEGKYHYYAVLSSDGKTLANGKWTEMVSRSKNGQWVEEPDSGDWSATLAAK